MIISIPIPENSKCLLKLGQKVDFNTPFLDQKNEKQITIPIAAKLGITSSKIFRYLKKFVGDPVKKGDLLAIKDNFLSANKIFSQYEGVVNTVNNENGDIEISISEGRNNILLAYFQGEIVEISKSEIKLKVSKGHEFELKSTNIDFGGSIIYFENDKFIINNNVNNKILFSEKISNYIQVKAEAIGVTGFITITKVPEITDIATAILKNLDDFKLIMKEKFTYCFINKSNSRIYFYV